MTNKNDSKQVRVYGAGGHSQVVQSVLSQNGFEVSEVFDDYPNFSHPLSKKVPSGNRDKNMDFPHEGAPFIVAIGNNKQRAEVAKFLKTDFLKAIHHSAIIDPSSTIKKGTVVYAGSVIQTNTFIGEHVIINTLAGVGHDNIIHDFVHISPNAALCGHVEVGEGTQIGAGAVVIPTIKIGKWCTIGAGSVILKDVPDYAVVVGNPGRVIKMNRQLII